MDAYSHSVDSDSDNCDSLNDKLVNYVDEVQKIQNFLGKQRASNDDDVGIEKNEFEGKLVLTFNSKIIGFSSSDKEKGKQESARESPRKIDAPPMLLPVRLFFYISIVSSSSQLLNIKRYSWKLFLMPYRK
ncbi:hypothetical protein SAY87_009069 [Trapa incisa]|uniref:Uncharacterized protein n=1 Tax=Trapa incisa TaxID=236973 RepID=A0AAN7PW82_9MYRT|nr:hypothetical protein SAY87_009069 [Trapa incisa]